MGSEHVESHTICLDRRVSTALSSSDMVSTHTHASTTGAPVAATGAAVAGSTGEGVTGSTGAGVTGSTGAGVTGSMGAGVTGSTGAGVTGTTGARVGGSTGAGVGGLTGAAVTGPGVSGKMSNGAGVSGNRDPSKSDGDAVGLLVDRRSSSQVRQSPCVYWRWGWDEWDKKGLLHVTRDDRFGWCWR